MNKNSIIPRLFFAIKPNSKLRQFLVDCTRELKQRPWEHRIRWLSPANLHLTLHFFGSLESNKVSYLLEQTRQAIQSIPCFLLSLDSIRLFPTANTPRTIAVHFKATPELFELAYAVREGAMGVGSIPPKIQPYLPHLTLGYIDQHKGSVPQLEINLSTDPMPVHTIELLSSHYSKHTPIYELISAIELYQGLKSPIKDSSF